MSYSTAIDYLYSLQKFGIKLGLDKTEAILSLVGNPHKQLRCIHVAGTNGKGSVSAMTASILRAYGFRVGLFTSPHLVSFTERIRVNDREISEAEVADLTDEIRAAADCADKELNPTFFEIVTAVAFVYFVRQKADWVVVETGLGGRLDDMVQFFIKMTAVISATAERKSAPLFICGDEFTGSLRSSGMEGTRFDYSDGTTHIEDLFTPLAGEYQVMNAALAVKAASIAFERQDTKISAEDRKHLISETIRAGLAATRWRGRLELVSSDPPVIVDGAHNAGAAAALAGFIKKYLSDRKIILVLGIMADKEIQNILDALLPVADEIIFTAPAYSRAESPQQLAVRARSAGFNNVLVTATIRDALAAAKERQSVFSGDKSAVAVITGSFYTAGEALEALGEKSVLSTLRETL